MSGDARKVETPEEKKFRIQLGVVKRLTKEHRSYIQEEKKGEADISVMKNSPNPDPYMLKKMGECVQESRAMIRNSAHRLCLACDELRQAMEASGKSAEDAQVVEAQQLISQCSEQLSYRKLLKVKEGELASRSL